MLGTSYVEAFYISKQTPNYFQTIVSLCEASSGTYATLDTKCYGGKGAVDPTQRRVTLFSIT